MGEGETTDIEKMKSMEGSWKKYRRKLSNKKLFDHKNVKEIEGKEKLISEKYCELSDLKSTQSARSGISLPERFSDLDYFNSSRNVVRLPNRKKTIKPKKNETKKELGKEKERKGKKEEDKVITSYYKITRHYEKESDSISLSRKRKQDFEILEDSKKMKHFMVGSQD